MYISVKSNSIFLKDGKTLVTKELSTFQLMNLVDKVMGFYLFFKQDAPKQKAHFFPNGNGRTFTENMICILVLTNGFVFRHF